MVRRDWDEEDSFASFLFLQGDVFHFLKLDEVASALFFLSPIVYLYLCLCRWLYLYFHLYFYFYFYLCNTNSLYIKEIDIDIEVNRNWNWEIQRFRDSPHPRVPESPNPVHSSAEKRKNRMGVDHPLFLHFLVGGLDDSFLNEREDEGGSALHPLHKGVDDGGSAIHFLPLLVHLYIYRHRER